MAQAQHQRGAFIVLEGLDRSGKSSQCQKLIETLQNHGIKAKSGRFPDRTTTIGKMINSYLTNGSNLDDHSIHLLFSANRWEKASSILEDLQQGITIVVDRYAFSGIAFSAAKGLDYEWCKNPDIGLPAPDLVLFLDVDKETQESRGGYGAERYETSSMQLKVAQIFREQIAPDTQEHGVKWETVDARKSFDTVSQHIESLALEVVNKNKPELSKLFIRL